MTGKSKQQPTSIGEPTPETRAVVTTVDNTGNDNILLVPVKAQAGYLLGAQQPEYIERPPAFWIPGLGYGTYLAFEISGYSMVADCIGFSPSEGAICEHVERLEEIKDELIYVIVNDAPEVDNIVIKRCLNTSTRVGL